MRLFKVLFSISFFITSIYASILFDKVENLLGSDKFNLHNKLLHLVFKDQEQFYLDNNTTLDYKNILKVLNNNGLIDLKYNAPANISIEFELKNSAIKSLKILNETLRGMGYAFYFTKEIRYDTNNNNLIWIINLKTEYMLDPFLFIQELKSKYCKILDVTRVNQFYWRYKLNLANAKILESKKVENGEKIIFQKPLRAYFLEVNSPKELKIISRKLNNWFPYIVFYDKDLNILDTIKKNRVYRGLKSNVPYGTHYIKITDRYTLINIKRGLSITIK